MSNEFLKFQLPNLHVPGFRSKPKLTHREAAAMTNRNLIVTCNVLVARLNATTKLLVNLQAIVN